MQIFQTAMEVSLPDQFQVEDSITTTVPACEVCRPVHRENQSRNKSIANSIAALEISTSLSSSHLPCLFFHQPSSPSLPSSCKSTDEHFPGSSSSKNPQPRHNRHSHPLALDNLILQVVGVIPIRLQAHADSAQVLLHFSNILLASLTHRKPPSIIAVFLHGQQNGIVVFPAPTSHFPYYPRIFFVILNQHNVYEDHLESLTKTVILLLAVDVV